MVLSLNRKREWLLVIRDQEPQDFFLRWQIDKVGRSSLTPNQTCFHYQTDWVAFISRCWQIVSAYNFLFIYSNEEQNHTLYNRCRYIEIKSAYSLISYTIKLIFGFISMLHLYILCIIIHVYIKVVVEWTYILYLHVGMVKKYLKVQVQYKCFYTFRYLKKRSSTHTPIKIFYCITLLIFYFIM